MLPASRETDKTDRMQSKGLKQLLQVPISTSITGVLEKTVLWPAKKYLEYSAMMLWHSIINSEEKHMAKNTDKEQ